MVEQSVLSFLQQVEKTSDTPEVIFSKVLPKLGEWLQCDRCFLYLRYPPTQMGKVTHCWRRNSEFPEVIDADWKQEPKSLPQTDPLFAAALQAQPSIFVEDVETASPEVVNLEFEQENFGHRALVHAHLLHAGLLWGVLQPCIFNQPRHWTLVDQNIVTAVEQLITPLVVSYVNRCFLSDL